MISWKKKKGISPIFDRRQGAVRVIILVVVILWLAAIGWLYMEGSYLGKSLREPVPKWSAQGEEKTRTDQSSPDQSDKKTKLEPALPGQPDEKTKTESAPSGQPVKKAEAESAKTASKNGDKKYTVQVAAVKTSEQAERLVKELKAKGFEAYYSNPDGPKRSYYRVRVGRFENKAEAGSMKEKLTEAGYQGVFLYQLSD